MGDDVGPVMLSPTRRRALARLYGLSEEDYEAIWAQQQGRCGMCDRPFTAGRPPHVDHSHSSGIVRGLLDQVCNYEMLGRSEDPDYFARVAAYLRFPPAVTAIGQHRVPGSPPAASPKPVWEQLSMEMEGPEH
jgi:recombination endonuclease VII